MGVILKTFITSVFLLAVNVNAQVQTVTTYTNSAPAPLPSVPPPVLEAPSYTYPFTYTTPTVRWTTPTFPTSTAVPSCSETMCPALNGQSCADSQGVVYGVLCNTRFGGTIITSAGKHKMEKSRKEKRGYTGSLDTCLGFCDMYTSKMCKGADYSGGFCHYYAVISGTIDTPGEVALVRQL